MVSEGHRRLGALVRAGRLDLETAIHKLTGLAARHMGLDERGRIRPGSHADLVLLNPDRVAASATFEQPQLTAKGIEKVWVNGALVWDAGKWTGSKPGAVVLGPGARP